MTSPLKRTGRMAWALAVLFLLSAGIAGAQTGSNQDFSASARLERHFQHEDRIYGAQSASAAALARHFNHEDRIYGAQSASAAALARHFNHEDRIYGAQSTSAAALARHFNHEDAIYGAQRSESRRAPLPAPTAASSRLDRKDTLLSVGAALVVLLVGTAAVFTVRRGRSGAPLSES
jgi:hypothetical protein